MTTAAIWRVALPTPIADYFDYLPYSASRAVEAMPGMRVEVSFGRQTLVGVLLSQEHSTTISHDKLKPVLSVLDQAPALDAAVLALCRWASQYYQYPLGEVVKAALPKYWRAQRPLALAAPVVYTITAAGAAALAGIEKKAPRQYATLQALTAGVLEKSDLQAVAGSASVIHALLEKAWIAPRVTPSPDRSAMEVSQPCLILNDQQAAALMAITSTRGFAAHLLAGVTGSGKTEVYLQAIASILARGQQALVLVPEIGLTVQTVQRFEARFGARVGVLHSALSDKERATVWLKAQQGQLAVLIGTRSAVFAVMPRLGIIVVDEEHDLSFKSQSHLRYSARDVAVMRARMADIPVVLGSATPSLESVYNGQRGRYRVSTLSQRAGDALLPRVEVIDLKKQTMTSGLSAPLLAVMGKTLARGRQVLLILNRRGYAPLLLCHDCGYIQMCRDCDVRVTWHRGANLWVCHSCQRQYTPKRICPDCRCSDLSAVGQGTEQIEQTISAEFPHHTVVRMDRDTIGDAHLMAPLLDQIRDGAADIIIGTQMLAKGHHFPNLALSVIVDCDSGFFSRDFRALEHQAQLIWQVAGRAGRTKEQGQVLIQTHYPEHPALQVLLQQGYGAFADYVLLERKEVCLPPYSHQALIWASALAAEPAQQFLLQLKQKAKVEGCVIRGPVPATLARKQRRYYYQLLLQSTSRQQLQVGLKALLDRIDNKAVPRGLRWLVDVDPQETL